MYYNRHPPQLVAYETRDVGLRAVTQLNVSLANMGICGKVTDASLMPQDTRDHRLMGHGCNDPE